MGFPVRSYYVLCYLLFTAVVMEIVAGQQQQRSLFREDIFPEQLLQQQLQLKQNGIQVQLQDLQRQFQVNAGNSAIFRSLQTKQAELMLQLQEINRELLILQQQLQDRLTGGVHKFDIPTLTRPDVFQQRPPIITRTDEQPPIITTTTTATPASSPAAAMPIGDGAFCLTNFNQPGVCSPLVKCLSFHDQITDTENNRCILTEGEFGVCCPQHRLRVSDSVGRIHIGILQSPREPVVEVPQFTPEQIDSSIIAALDKIHERQEFVSNLFIKRVLIESGSAAARHQELFPTTNETLQVGEKAQAGVEASVELVNDFNLSPQQGTFGLPKFSILNTVLGDTCPKQSFCHPHKYRSTDGSCNNLQHQQWGSPGTALQRILPPKYGDGINSPRTHADSGRPLPSTRMVSVHFAQDKDVPSDNYTLILMQWGQFVDHDVTHTPISRGQSGFGISCCRNGKLIDASLRHPDCFAIEIPPNDHMFSKFGEQCMEFVRSLPAPRPECNFGPREQMNQITGYLDGSAVYGSSLNAQKALRLLQGGKLRAQNVRGKELLPGNPSECADDLQKLACFTAGDGRINEQIELVLMHTIWLREHNRIADILSSMHPNWSDEAIFQEARRIVVAEIQHITYNEFLPILLGQQYMASLQLTPKESGWTRFYDADLNAGITNVFATAAYRFGHTLIQENIHGYGKFGNIRENLKLSKQHFAPFDLYRDGVVDDFIRGLSFQSSQSYDRFFTKQITDHLFQGSSLNFGLDLVALNLQRGRDHGLPPYNDWREVCGLKRARTWNDLESLMDVESIERLSNLYDDVNEVDLFVAGVAERPLPGALLGPTFVCIIGDQFARLRRGDRFFYEEANQLSSFSQAQLNEIRKVSLARVLCDNSDNLVVMQPLAFLKPSFLNQRVSCNSRAIPFLDLRAWAEEVSAVP